MNARETADEGDGVMNPSLADMIRVDEACDRFESAWRAGERPDPAVFLVEVVRSSRAVLLRELLALDLDYRRERGERPDPDDYRARFTEHPDVVAAAFAVFEPGAKTLVAPDGLARSAILTDRLTQPGEVLPNAELGPAALDALREAGYEILGELGRGGMGVVYLAHKVALNRRCALKMILAGGHAGKAALTRFRAEAEAIARLQHPDIVQIYHVGEVNGLPYLELEYLPGGSLDRLLDGVPWPPSTAAKLVETLARAIAEAHHQGIIHRDLKPANILLDAGRRPKVADFGLAKVLGSDDGLTKTQTILGSPSYMAPEQAEGNSRGVGATTDVYALGAIFYELLTGRPPFRAATALETLALVRETDPVPPSRFQPGLPRAAEIICLKCLEKTPGRRYPTAEALAEDLGRFLAGESILAQAAPPWQLAWRWTRRRPTVAAALGVSVAALVVILGAGVYYNARLREAAQNARSAARSAVAQRNLALSAYDQLVFDVQERLGVSAATRPARRALLNTAIQGLDQIAKSTEGAAPDLSRAVAHAKLGAIYREVGLAAEAHRQLDLARELAERLAAASPPILPPPNASRDALAGIGGLSVEAGHPDAALKPLRKVVALSERIADREPNRPGVRRGLIDAYLQLGRAYGFNHERSAAEDWFRKMHDEAERWVADEPDNTLALDLLATSFRKLGDERKLVKDYEGARANYIRAIEINRQLVADEPGSVEFPHHLAVALEDFAEVAYSQGRIAEARSLFEESERRFAEQVEADPENRDVQFRLIVAQSKFAGLERDESQFPRAAALFRRALTRLEALGQQGRLDDRPEYWNRKLTEIRDELARCSAAPSPGP